MNCRMGFNTKNVSAYNYHNNQDTKTNRPSNQSNAGAVPVKNKKGEVSMQKVKVQRYISGKVPDFARKDYRQEDSDEDDDSDDDDFTSRSKSSRHRSSGHSRSYNDDHRRDSGDEDEAPRHHQRSNTIEFERIRER